MPFDCVVGPLSPLAPPLPCLGRGTSPWRRAGTRSCSSSVRGASPSCCVPGYPPGSSVSGARRSGSAIVTNLVSIAQALDLVRLRGRRAAAARDRYAGTACRSAMPDPDAPVTVWRTDPRSRTGVDRCAVRAAPPAPARRSGLRAP